VRDRVDLRRWLAVWPNGRRLKVLADHVWTLKEIVALLD
jgi:hypothetical protein